MEGTTIKVSHKTVDELKAIKITKRESYDEIITRLLKVKV